MDTKQCKSPSPRRGACVGVYQDTCLTLSVGDSPPTLQKGSNDISKPAKILTSDVGTTTSLRGSAVPGPCLAARFLAVSVLYTPWPFCLLSLTPLRKGGSQVRSTGEALWGLRQLTSPPPPQASPCPSAQDTLLCFRGGGRIG